MENIANLLDKKKEIITNLVDASVKYSVAAEALQRIHLGYEPGDISGQESKANQYQNQINIYRTEITKVNEELTAEFKQDQRYKCSSCNDKTPGKIPMFLGLQFNCVCEGTQLRVDARIIVQTESKQLIRSLEDRIRNKLVSTH